MTPFHTETAFVGLDERKSGSEDISGKARACYIINRYTFLLSSLYLGYPEPLHLLTPTNRVTHSESFTFCAGMMVLALRCVIDMGPRTDPSFTKLQRLPDT